VAQAILTRADYALVQVSRALSPLFRVLADLEHELAGERLAEVKIEAPVFVTGLARAGTTMMLTLLSQAAGVATHRYRDFPFLFVPLAWNWFQDRLGAAPLAVRIGKRVGGDLCHNAGVDAGQAGGLAHAAVPSAPRKSQGLSAPSPRARPSAPSR